MNLPMSNRLLYVTKRQITEEEVLVRYPEEEVLLQRRIRTFLRLSSISCVEFPCWLSTVSSFSKELEEKVRLLYKYILNSFIDWHTLAARFQPGGPEIRFWSRSVRIYSWRQERAVLYAIVLREWREATCKGKEAKREIFWSGRASSATARH